MQMAELSDLGVYTSGRGYLSVCKYNEIVPLKRVKTHPQLKDETFGEIPADAQVIGL